MRKFPVRASIDHSPPYWDLHSEWFITICTTSQGQNTLCDWDKSNALLGAIQKYHVGFVWYADIAVLMPDHLHLIISIPEKSHLSEVIRGFKRWATKHLKISWQRGFFEHRLRSYSSANQKYKYVLNNPVRAGLVKSPEEWPFTFIGRNRDYGRLGTTAPTESRFPAR